MKKFLKAAIPTLAMLLVAIMALTGTTYAWFTQNDTASASGIDITVQAAGGLLLSETGAEGTWTSNLDMNKNIEGFAPVSCDGNTMTFYKAELSSAIAYIKANGISQVTDNTGNKNWLQLTIHVKNDSTEAKTIKFNGCDITGNAAAAARVAVFNGATKLAVFDTEAESTNGLKSATLAVDTLVTATGAHTTTYTPTKITAANQSFNLAANGETTLNVWVWLEGQDKDCVNALALQSFAVSLGFKAETQAAS